MGILNDGLGKSGVQVGGQFKAMLLLDRRADLEGVLIPSMMVRAAMVAMSTGLSCNRAKQATAEWVRPGPVAAWGNHPSITSA